MAINIDPFNGSSAMEIKFADTLVLRNPIPAASGFTKAQWSKYFIEKMIRQTLKSWLDEDAKKTVSGDFTGIPAEQY